MNTKAKLLGALLPLMGLASLFTARVAFAQADESAPEAPVAPAPSTESGEGLPAQPVAPAGTGGTACLVFNNGLDPASAATGGQLVCDEIRNQGAPIVPSGQASAAAYRVHFDRLGAQLIVRATYEAPIGHVLRSRRLILKNVEEVPVAAPRLARAIVQDEPIAESQRMDNLVGEETRKLEKKPGEFLWGFGVIASSAPSEGAWMSPGIEFMGYYETPRYGVGFSLRSTFGSGEKKYLAASLGVGGRYFFSDADIAPFAGAGLAISGMEIRTDAAEYSNDSGTGIAAFGEVGVEFLRLTSSRLIVSARAEAPFYALKHDSYDYPSGKTESGSRWVPPLTIAMTYAW